MRPQQPVETQEKTQGLILFNKLSRTIQYQRRELFSILQLARVLYGLSILDMVFLFSTTQKDDLKLKKRRKQKKQIRIIQPQFKFSQKTQVQNITFPIFQGEYLQNFQVYVVSYFIFHPTLQKILLKILDYTILLLQKLVFLDLSKHVSSPRFFTRIKRHQNFEFPTSNSIIITRSSISKLTQIMDPDEPLTNKQPKFSRKKSKNRKKIKVVPQQNQVQCAYSNAIYQKFLEILSKRRRNFLKQHLTQYYGKNFPINYKQHYRFKEQWENNRIILEKITQSHINQSSNIDIVLSVITILVYFATIWLTTIDIFFDNYETILLYYETNSLAMIVTIANLYFRYLQFKRENQLTIKIQEFLKKQAFTIITMCYFIFKVALTNCFNLVPFIILQTLVLLYLYREASVRYQCFRLMSFSLRYEYQTKVFDLIMTIFIIAHFISLVLHLATRVNPEQNWMTPLQIDPAHYFTQYVYAFYFTTTTILTVGYGDLLPRNPFEVFVVVMVQIFGIAMLGYVINEIGWCISSLRKGREAIERDLTTVEKMKKHYKMGAPLTHRLRSYLVSSKPDFDKLSPEEEKGILLKVNEQIRMDLLKQNMMAVIKSSIFFVCRWSYSFQKSISKKLIHVLFNPNDILYQPKDNQRIYIVKSGKVSVHISRIHGNQKFKNTLKKISNSIDQEVSDNCYGYTSAISSRPVKIFAISKQFTSAYYIQKDQFLQSVYQNIPDTQFYHQIKSRIDQAYACQSFQVPNLQNSKQHYHPTKYYLIRKYCKADYDTCTRKSIIRRDCRAFRGQKLIYNQETIDQVRRCFMGSIAQSNADLYEDSENGFRESTKRKYNDSDEFYKFVMQNNIAANFHHYFESSKQYSNYFTRCNKSLILRKFETENYMRHQDQIKSQCNLRQTYTANSQNL